MDLCVTQASPLLSWWEKGLGDEGGISGKGSMKRILTLFLLTIAALLPGVAWAEQGRIFKTEAGDIYVYGLSAGEQVAVGTQWARRRVNPDVCGQLVIKPSSKYPLATIRVNDTDIDPASLLVQPLATCNESARVLTSTRTANYKTSRNWIVLINMPYVPHVIYYPDRLQARSAKVNQCGFVQLKDLPRQPFEPVLRLPTTDGKTARFTVAELPTFLPLTCRKGTLLVPPGWAPPLAQGIAGSASEANEIGFAGSTRLVSGGGSGSGGSGTVSFGIRGAIVSHPGWSGVVVTDAGWNQYSGQAPVQAAKTPDNTIVVANYPGNGTDDWGSYSSAVGPVEDGDWSFSPAKNACGYVVLTNWRDPGGVVIYQIRSGEFDPIGSFALEDLPTLQGGILEDLAAGCKS